MHEKVQKTNSVLYNNSIVVRISPLKNNDLIDFKDVISTISELEGISLNITSIKDMKDIQGESNYFFIKMNKGYAIITKEKVISEYSLDEDSIPYDDDEEELVYAGPYNYYSNKTQINQSMISKESFNKVVKEFAFNRKL